MRQGNPRGGGAGRGGGDAGHDLGPDAGGIEGLQLLAAAPEDEGVAALKANHPFAQARLGDEDIVDLVLGHRMAARGLAHVDTVGIAAREVEHAVADQPVVDDDVGLFQKALAPQGDEVRRSRPGADDMDDAVLIPAAPVDVGQHVLGRPLLVAGQHAGGDGPVEKSVPEPQPRPAVGHHGLHSPPEAFGEQGEAAQVGGQQAFDRGLHAPRQHGRGPTRRHGDGDGVALDDGRGDEIG